MNYNRTEQEKKMENLWPDKLVKEIEYATRQAERTQSTMPGRPESYMTPRLLRAHRALADHVDRLGDVAEKQKQKQYEELLRKYDKEYAYELVYGADAAWKRFRR